MAVLPLCLALMLQAAAPVPEPGAEALQEPLRGSATVKGAVVLADGQPVPLAQAVLEGERPAHGPLFRISNQHGVFVFGDLPAGRYHLHVYKPDHTAPPPVSIRVREETYREFLIRLRPSPRPEAAGQEADGVIQGFVLYADREAGPRPAPAVGIVLTAESGVLGGLTSTTDERGFFRFSQVPIGVYRLSARHGESVAEHREAIRILEGSVQEVVLRIGPQGVAAGGSGRMAHVPLPGFPARADAPSR